MRRVVVTGLGMVSPLGCGVETTWANLIAGKSGAVRVTDFPVDDIACQIACQIPRGAKAEGKFDRDEWMEPKESRKVDDFIIYAVAAADQALDDAGWHPETYEDQTATGVLIGSGIGGLRGIEEAALIAPRQGPAADQPVLHSRPADQPRLRPGLDPPRPEGSQPCRGHRLLDRRARHRRREPADHVRRRAT